MGIFKKQQRHKRSHGHRHYNKKTPQLDSSIDTYVNLIDSIDQPQGVHKTKTTLFSMSLPKLCELQSLAQKSTNYDYESAEYRVTAIILDTAKSRLFRPVRSDLQSTDAKTQFIKRTFTNKGIDAMNLPSIATRAITKNRNDISRPPARLRQTLTFVFRHFHRISFQRGQFLIVILKLLD